MTVAFNKYQGTGNDFIIIDNRNSVFNPDNRVLISKLCQRRLGIGADGLILINTSDDYDFEMVYFNADGNKSTMCGNGGRCAADFAIKTGIAGNNLSFKAVDGVHEAIQEEGIIRLSMNDVTDLKIIINNYFINTGSPHYIVFAEDADAADVIGEGRKLRWSPEFPEGGTNVNFVQVESNGIYVRTFERGVEDETLSCGTGVTASAIAAVRAGHFDSGPVNVRTRGGNLKVEFEIKGEMITGIWVSGPAVCVFEGLIEI